MSAAKLAAAEVLAAQEEAVLTRRKEIEAERLSRLTAKTYKVGIDTEALASQIADKQASQLEENAQDRAYDELRLNVDKHLMYVDQQRDSYLRQRDIDVAVYRKNEQKYKDRREFDLNDPDALRKDKPARAGDEDPDLSVSGLQKFAGEDLHLAERVRQQHAQLRSWCEAKAHEKAEKDKAEKQTDELWASHMLEADLLRCEYADKEAEMLRQRQKEIADYNIAQSELQKTMRAEARVQAEVDAVTEIQDQLNSAFLTEDPALTRSFVQPHRPRPDHYKGLSPAERQAIMEERTAQVQERKVRDAEEKELDQKISDMTMHWNRVATLQEHEVEKRRAGLRKKLADEHKAQAIEKTQRYTQLYKEAYVNRIDDSFFNKFGQSAR